MGRSMTALVMVLMMVLGACGDSGGAVKTSATSPPEVFTMDTLEAVCRDIPSPRSASYDAAVPGPHPVAVFEGEAPEFRQSFVSLPTGWTVLEFERYPDISLVACLDRTSTELLQVCDQYEVDLEGDYVVETYASTYDVTVRVATTGEVLDSTTIEVAQDECPGFVMFTEGEYTEQWYGSYADALQAFLASHVSGG